MGRSMRFWRGSKVARVPVCRIIQKAKGRTIYPWKESILIV